jgi:hypothetical protein
MIEKIAWIIFFVSLLIVFLELGICVCEWLWPRTFNDNQYDPFRRDDND